jgi:acyl carrier protein
MNSREQIFAVVRDSLVELFELDPSRIVPGARFDDDLELDSIDAVDLIEHLTRRFKKNVSQQDFRSVHTVDDLVGVIDRLQGQ